MERFILNSEGAACLISVNWKVNIKTQGKQIAKCSATYDGLATSDAEMLRIFADTSRSRTP